MMLPVPSNKVTDDERQRIVAALAAGKSIHSVAKDFGRSKSTIGGIANAANVTPERADTKKATEAKRAANALRRTELEAQFLVDSQRLLAQLWEPCVQRKAMVVSHGHGLGSSVKIVEIDFEQPTFSEQYTLVQASKCAADASLMVGRADESGGTQAKSMLMRIVDGLAEMAAA